jgi:type I restriction enzyme S subunit
VGSSKRVFTSEFTKTGIPFYRGTEVAQLSLEGTVEPKYFISEDHYEILKSATGIPAVGDILLPSICAKGEVWRVDTDSPFYFKDGRVLWIQLDYGAINSEYFCYALRDTLIRNFAKIASGTTFSEMKIFLLKDLSVLVPPLDQQKFFSDFIWMVKQQRIALKESLGILETINKSVYQKAFNGELFQ